ncbi:MAG: aminodeoxychorismate/anthranilate synthase component II [Rhodospirillales bacterium]|nr:aminodeoxychorismate/anthranilate synthase component II [Rhodospirillales bacterium]MCY4003773.1 aminodeoxychorismate/anthranilate synthase component II [Rhodospirillales bacterium]MCY4098714.1 aminodeoxychorismate/anthranilate synthase component II [Rhodospirillales bacterium]MDE0374180.1 aminodeoxychorismate/anthranilate synthase component II [Rhodospirillales bacterium]MYE20049.1 aminodeoxychorismate/anthranilate synthase component II [Rhodospirillales bacterium]
MYVLIDNYDSFTWNLWHYLEELGASVEVHRNDTLSVDDVLARKPAGIVLSPGPCTPDQAGICLELVRAAAGRTPVLGVCLGHQSIGQAFGGRVVRARTVMHGKTSPIQHDGSAIFRGLPSPFTAARYHSLILERGSMPDCLRITAETRDGVIMGIQHVRHALFGVQFHPESIASEQGHALLRNFLDATGMERSV